VFEHVYDPRLAIARMATALKSGGLLLHKVDFRDHGMFSDRMHELTFFEVPDSLYSLMTRDTGRPNRVLIDTYRKALTELVADHDLLVTRLAGVGDIDLIFRTINRLRPANEGCRYVPSRPLEIREVAGLPTRTCRSPGSSGGADTGAPRARLWLKVASEPKQPRFIQG
jgi:hypothetical protein